MNHKIRALTFAKPRVTSIRYGFSLIELIVIVVIIGVLIAFLFPAVLASRETGRRVKCQNNLKNLSLALLAQHTAVTHFPSGGWGHTWVGVPGRGSGKHQPGGWIYSVLPFIDERSLHELGDKAAGAAANRLFSQRLQTALSIFTCPTRRPSQALPVSSSFSYVKSPKPFGHVERVARADYAINGGTSRVFSTPGPADVVEGDSAAYWAGHVSANGFDGISHLRQGTTLASIADGASHTYLIGEKHVNGNQYYSGESPGDNESMYAGYCSDLHRVAGMTERLDQGKSPFVLPLSDDDRGEIDIPDFVRFGSAHVSGVNMAYCDGGVRLVSFDVDGEVHFRSAHRRDLGRPVESLR